MPLHPQAEAHLGRLAATRFAEMHTLTPEQIRQGMRRMLAAMPPPKEVASVTERQVSLPSGTLELRVYHPAPQERLPVIVFFHGGGFVLGDLDTHDGLARSLALACAAVVVSVAYPLAPEHKFPAAVDAAYDATAWVAAHAAELGADGSRLAVAGDSAGGNLAAVTALKAREAGAPRIALQLLIYPDLDFRRTNESIRALAGQYGNISREMQGWFMDHYLAHDAQKLEPRVSPLLAPDLGGLPAAHIVTAEFDALRDEGEAYAQRLREAGVPVTLKRYDGMIHEFMRWPFDASEAALQDAAASCRAALGA
ncbi:MAG: alpha/beta hydrolase [Rhizobacter sp.]|nr:alpha/beta hydrolase [Rhizobacter sp.]